MRANRRPAPPGSPGTLPLFPPGRCMIRSRITGIGFHQFRRGRKPTTTSNRWWTRATRGSSNAPASVSAISSRGDVGSSDLGIEAAQALADAGSAAPGRGLRDLRHDDGPTGCSRQRRDRAGEARARHRGRARRAQRVQRLPLFAQRRGRVRAHGPVPVRARDRRRGAEHRFDLRTEGRDMAVLFGDSAGAAVVEPSTDERHPVVVAAQRRAVRARAVVRGAVVARCRAASRSRCSKRRQLPRNERAAGVQNATTRFPEVIHEVPRKAGHTLDEVALVVPHQGNQRIGDAVVQRLGVPPEKVFQKRYGQHDCGEHPDRAHQARRGPRGDGDLVVPAAFGAGLRGRVQPCGSGRASATAAKEKPPRAKVPGGFFVSLTFRRSAGLWNTFWTSSSCSRASIIFGHGGRLWSSGSSVIVCGMYSCSAEIGVIFRSSDRRLLQLPNSLNAPRTISWRRPSRRRPRPSPRGRGRSVRVPAPRRRGLRASGGRRPCA